IKKYGIITKGNVIINQKKKYDRLNKDKNERAIVEAINNN
ncbi:thioredoxin-like protein, partial [Clostridioides difficile]|nr:thioredoxin-like protein [Clostridioides difficile]